MIDLYNLQGNKSLTPEQLASYQKIPKEIMEILPRLTDEIESLREEVRRLEIEISC